MPCNFGSWRSNGRIKDIINTDPVWNNERMTDDEIIKAICSSAPEQNRALEQIYRYKGAEFKRFFQFKGLPLANCEDVLQDAILKIFKGAKDFRGSGGFSENSANAWMWTIARNCLNDNLKRGQSGNSVEDKTNNVLIQKLKREQAIKVGVKDGKKIFFPYIEPSHESSVTMGGSLDDTDWAEKHGSDIGAGESYLIHDQVIRTRQLEIDLCVSKGIEDFCAEYPDRALVLMMQMDGESIESIARRIARTGAATKEYISQCKIRLKPYVEHCLAFVTE